MKGKKQRPPESGLFILRTEGLQSLMNRVAEGGEEGRRLRNLKELSIKGGRLEMAPGLTPALNVSAAAPNSRLHDVHLQMFDRLAVEKEKRTVAITYPKDGAWWLEVWSGERAGYLQIGGKASLVDTLTEAASHVRAPVVHFEDFRGLPLGLVQALEKRGLLTAVSVYDFSFFCRRPQLIEMPAGRFCAFSKDPERCDACLKDIDPEGRYPQADYRQVAADALHATHLVIYPSHYMQRRHQVLFPERRPDQREIVIPPATAREQGPPAKAGERPNVAFIGGTEIEAGPFLIPPIMEGILKQRPKVSGFIYGTGDAEMLKRASKAKRVSIKGHYRKGTLPSLLARDRIGVAVLPAIWPNPYGLVIDECLSAGVPVVALDLGSVADRLRYWEVGSVVPLKGGVEGLAEAAADVLNGQDRVPQPIIKTLPTIDRAAQRHIEMYKFLRIRAQKSKR